jgi:hypothetical protein
MTPRWLEDSSWLRADSGLRCVWHNRADNDRCVLAGDAATMPLLAASGAAGGRTLARSPSPLSAGARLCVPLMLDSREEGITR